MGQTKPLENANHLFAENFSKIPRKMREVKIIIIKLLLKLYQFWTGVEGEIEKKVSKLHL